MKGENGMSVQRTFLITRFTCN